MGDDTVNKHMINWQYFNLRFWIYRLWWFIIGGKTIMVPMVPKTIVVDHNHPLWYDVGARQVEITTDDPMWVYGPWLEEHVGKRNRDWHIVVIKNVERVVIGNIPIDVHTADVEIQFRKGKDYWANLAVLKWT